ncbi:MAG: hypothetical protein Unbinned5089contig1000_16 [Prokaryotic dsDNA virus sp.]|nr:MAG: hypothetical protein Unbinned5089contig1000_16 [Prokaryotic dsDNA virus sp.]|tara:strand:+ start:3552 stop:4640 length:1089 start_codon:yes stop_codon:yes gene_type:complete
MATISQAELKIYIYSGIAGNKPTTPQYTLTKDKLASEDIIVFEVAELVKDYIDVYFNGDYDTITQTAWVDFDITRTFDDDSTDTLTKRAIAFLGYGEFEDGINPTLSTSFLASNTYFYIDCGERAYIPVYVSTDGTYKVEYFKGNTSLIAYKIGGSVTDISIDSRDIKIDNTTDNYRISQVSIRTADSTLFQEQKEIPPESDKVIVTSPNGTTETRYIRCLKECKHTPFKVSFMNKFGVIQDLWFFKRRDDSFEAEKEDYKRSILDIGSTGVSYSLYDHSKQILDVRATETLRMNTGFITEDHNEVIKQLMVTEKCWIHQDSTIVPVVPVTTSFQEKKEVNEKLINFTVEFSIANNYIQDIR